MEQNENTLTEVMESTVTAQQPVATKEDLAIAIKTAEETINVTDSKVSIKVNEESVTEEKDDEVAEPQTVSLSKIEITKVAVKL